MSRGTKHRASNPTASGSKKKSEMASGALISRSTRTRACTQDGEAAKPLMRGDILDLVQEVVTTLVTQGNSQVLDTNPTTNCEESSTPGAQSGAIRQTPTVTGMLSYFL